MVITQREARRILAGRKVQMRLARKRKPPEVGSTMPIGYRRPCEALHGRMEVVRLCRVMVLAVSEAHVSEATAEDAKDEGYRSLDELLAEHSGRTWVVQIEKIVEETPRFLSRKVIAGRQGGYTDDPRLALDDEPEAVDEVFQQVLATRAREREARRARRYAAELSRMPIDDQVAVLSNIARSRHVDVRDELRAIGRWVHNPPARMVQLTKLRAKLGIA